MEGETRAGEGGGGENEEGRKERSGGQRWMVGASGTRGGGTGSSLSFPLVGCASGEGGQIWRTPPPRPTPPPIPKKFSSGENEIWNREPILRGPFEAPQLFFVLILPPPPSRGPNTKHEVEREREAKEGEGGHRAVRGRWAPLPMEGGGPREAPDQTTPKASHQPPVDQHSPGRGVWRWHEGMRRGGGQQKQSNDPHNNQHNPQYANYWEPLTRERHIPAREGTRGGQGPRPPPQDMRHP